MGLFGKRKNKKASIVDLLDDLTHLEINTVIKDGMLASPGRSSMYDIVRDIFDSYIHAYYRILYNNDYIDTKGSTGKYYYVINNNAPKEFKDKKLKINDWGVNKYPLTFKELHVRLKSLERLLEQEKNLEMKVDNYTIFRRMASFCEYVMTLNTQVAIDETLIESESNTFKKGSLEDFYKIDIKRYKFSLPDDFSSANEVKLKRMRDLGTETIVMQTRVGIDGDVITRIERSFANDFGDEKTTREDAEASKKMIVDMHEKHIDISVKYWQSLINVVKDFVTGLINNKT